MNTTNEWLQIIDELGPRIAEGAAERDATDGFVGAHYASLNEAGLISALIPTELGGGGASHGDMVAILRRLGRYDGSMALALSMHQHLVAAQVWKHVHGQPAPVLEKVASNGLVLISTGARDWLQSNGRMTRVDGGYRVTARKAFASGGPAGNVLVTSAPYEHPTEGWQVLHFPVPMTSEGVRFEMDWKAHGMRATGSNTIVLDDVFVPDQAIALVRPRDAYHPVWNVVLTVALPLISAAYVGVAEHAFELSLQYASRRAQSTTVQWAVGEMHSDLILAQSTLDQMVALANNYDFEPSLERANRILALKTHTVEAVQRVAGTAIEAAGGPGFYRRTGLERLLRDARAGGFHPLPKRRQVEFTGRLALGLPPVEF